MSRWLAGSFDPGGGHAEAPVGALAPEVANAYFAAGIAVAYTGPASTTDPLCLFDGFLDNAAEIAAELGEPRAAGAERLLAAGYRRWGSGLPDRLRGDFALLVWDAERREGILARDQLGVRPIFVQRSGTVLRFASELKGLLAMLPATPAPDPAGVAHWIAVSSRPGTGTLYEGIERLGPGEAIALGRDGARRWRYWEPRFRQPLEEAGLAERVREALGIAVERRLAGPGETGVLMSGGLDSATVAALGRDRLLACSATFPEHPAADEAALIAELRERLDLPGVVAEVRPGGLVASAVEHLLAWRAPLLGWGDFWALPLMRGAAERGVTTVLDGDGGDELFGPRSQVLTDRLLAGRPRQALELARRLPGADRAGRRLKAATVARLLWDGGLPHGAQLAMRGSTTRRQAPAWLLRLTRAELAGSDDPAPWKLLDGPRWWASAAHGIASGIEGVGVFEHQRRRAALAGVEARHPLLDLDLVELCLRLPPEATLDPRLTRPLLREAMAGLLPDSVRQRPDKALFESVIVSCLRGPDAAAVRALLADGSAEVGAYVDLGRMRGELFDRDELSRSDPFRWMWRVWRLLNAELWLRSLAAGGALPAPCELAGARVEVG
ncbi:MAG TPA: asparagine synthase-related protein [Solirubrobacterales bacterium]|nr:asparagine synthase-related protein [Solirubrobacterales bacterium]